MGTRQGKSQAQSTNHNRIARAIFAAAESMGIADRKLLEELTSQIIQRLKPAPPLPGVEDLEAEIYRLGKTETCTSFIGNMVMKELKGLHYIACIRFTSIYPEFPDITVPKQEVKGLNSEDLPIQLPLIPKDKQPSEKLVIRREIR